MAASADRSSRRQGWLVLPGFLLLCLVVGYIGSRIAAGPATSWYPTLAKPSFSPPIQVVGPIWSPIWIALYVLMGIAVWRVWRTPSQQSGRRRALGLFFLLLALTLAWVLLFFGAHAIGAAAIELAVLFAFVVMTVHAFGALDRVAGFLLLPYAAWLGFAALLNFEIWRLN